MDKNNRFSEFYKYYWKKVISNEKYNYKCSVDDLLFFNIKDIKLHWKENHYIKPENEGKEYMKKLYERKSLDKKEFNDIWNEVYKKTKKDFIKSKKYWL